MYVSEYNKDLIAMDIEFGSIDIELSGKSDYKRNYFERNVSGFGETDIRQKVKLSENYGEYINNSDESSFIDKLLALLNCSSNLVVDLTLEMSNSLHCGFIKKDDTLFICKSVGFNSSYDIMKLILKSVIRQHVIVVFNKIDLLKYISSFIPSECSLVFCGEYCYYSDACSLNGMRKSLKICEHYYGESLNKLNNFANIMKHMSLVCKSRD